MNPIFTPSTTDLNDMIARAMAKCDASVALMSFRSRLTVRASTPLRSFFAKLDAKLPTGPSGRATGR